MGARQEHTGFLSPGQACPDHASGDQGLTMHKQGKASLQVMCRLVPVMRSWQRPHLRSACAQRRFPLVHICCLLSNSSHILQMQTSDFRCSLLALQCCILKSNECRADGMHAHADNMSAFLAGSCSTHVIVAAQVVRAVIVLGLSVGACRSAL